MSKPNIASLVSVLLLAGCPSAILRHVIAIVVDAVQAMSMFRCWSQSHVSKERLKALAPFLANLDTSTTIAKKHGIVDIGATLEHVCPGIILGRITKPMCGKTCSSHITVQATTRLCVAVSERYSADYGSHTTITQTKPPCSSMFSLRSFNYYQASVPIPGFVNHLAHLASNCKAALQKVPFAKNEAARRHFATGWLPVLILSKDSII
jgi:hypothetical protein